METGTRKFRTRLAILLLGVALLPAYALARDGSGMSFKDYDANQDGHLSLDEFQAGCKDDLAFRAADINGDEQVDPDEFDKYLARKAADQAGSGDCERTSPSPSRH